MEQWLNKKHLINQDSKSETKTNYEAGFSLLIVFLPVREKLVVLYSQFYIHVEYPLSMFLHYKGLDCLAFFHKHHIFAFFMKLSYCYLWTVLLSADQMILKRSGQSIEIESMPLKIRFIQKLSICILNLPYCWRTLPNLHSSKIPIRIIVSPQPV